MRPSRPPYARWRPLALGLTLAAVVLGGCSTIKPTQNRARELVFYDFAGAMRWGDFNKAYDFVDPKTKQEHPLTDLERERFKQIEVSGYEVLSKVVGTDTVDQQVRLDLINRNTQVPRNVIYREHWRWDPVVKTWWLVSGLPDISPQQ